MLKYGQILTKVILNSDIHHMDFTLSHSLFKRVFHPSPYQSQMY